MINVVFTATIVRKGKGIYIAHAQEFPITAEPASTQRGAVKKLKTAVLLRQRQEANAGSLLTFLDHAGKPSLCWYRS